MKYSLYFVSDKSELAVEKCRVWKRFFDIHVISTNPSFFTILFRKKAVFSIIRTGRLIDYLKRHLVKMLRKNFNYRSQAKSLIYDQQYNFNKLVVVHALQMVKILETNFTDNDKRNTLFFVLEHPKSASRFAEICKYIEKAKNENLYQVPKYTGSVILINISDVEFIKHLKDKYPNCRRFCLKFVDLSIDKVDTSKNLQENLEYSQDASVMQKKLLEIAKLGVDIYSYSKTEALFYNIKYEPNGVCFYQNLFSQCRSLKSYWFFAGDCGGIRKDIIFSIVRRLCVLKLPFLFIITGLTNDEKLQIEKINKMQIGKVLYNYVPYDRMLELEIDANIIVDLYRKTYDEGYSYRIPEALAMNKKILTNRPKVKKEPFYDEKYILMYNTNISDEVYLTFHNQSGCFYCYSDKKEYDVCNQIISL